MSSTKRGSQRSPADMYPTPAWVVHRLLDEVALPVGRWLEPGVGNGDIVRAVHQKLEGVQFTGFDIRNTKFIKKAALQPELGDYFVGNLLKPEGELLKTMQAVDLLSAEKWDVSIGNPPFRLAAEFIAFSLKYARNVALLLRLNYLGSDTRAEFMRSLAPDVFVLPNRPSFRPSKRGLLTTDSVEYAWFVWGDEPGRNRNEGRIKVLKTTPKEERRGR
jgi:hypothetical protein